jgi:hypothetical protein
MIDSVFKAIVSGPQSSSASRVTAGTFGFLTLTQCGERPERYGEPRRFETMTAQNCRLDE